jgi:hypothetical protein
VEAQSTFGIQGPYTVIPIPVILAKFQLKPTQFDFVQKFAELFEHFAKNWSSFG